MRVPLLQPLFTATARMLSDKSGASAAIVAIALPGLIGFGALGAEAGVWFAIKTRNQSAADAAAISAAYEVIAGTTDATSGLTLAASKAAISNGYQGATPAVTYPYSDAILNNGVAVVLQRTVSASLAAMFLPSVTVTTKAVTLIEPLDNACILALGTSSTDIEIADSVQLNMPDCAAVANSISSAAIALDGTTSSVTAATLVTAGEVSLEGNPIDPGAPPSELVLTSPVMIGAPTIADPYAATLTHTAVVAGMPTTPRCKSSLSNHVRSYPADCVVAGTSLSHAQIALSGNTQISGSWSIATGQTVDLAPGTYWVTGNLTVQSGAVVKCSMCDNIVGTGVTIILTAQTTTVGALSVAAGATVNLNAPYSGPFAGLVILQDSNDLPPGTTFSSNHSTIDGSSGSSINGLVYFPKSSITFHGNPITIGPQCLLLVVDAVEVDASASLVSAGCASAGLTLLPVIKTVVLAE
jgi:Putative Flp pilus-assembly TadE/G-like